jgi:tagatose 1,6-diphosphate aldolase GatY/KbaY
MLARGTKDLTEAWHGGWAIPAFSIYNLEQALAVCAAVEATGRPAIVQAGSSAFGYAGQPTLAALALAAAEQGDGAVAVHLDHATDLEEIDACLRAGYSSVMFDGSKLPLDDNIDATRAVVRRAAVHGAWVEGELAGFAGEEDASTEAIAGALTDPADAERFVAETGVAALAVAIGNVHGIPPQPVRLDLERLAAIRERVQVPLVLHGASGLAEADVTAAIGLGIAKVNINTELRRAFLAGLLAAAQDPPPDDALAPFMEPALARMRDFAAAMLRRLGLGREYAAPEVAA